VQLAASDQFDQVACHCKIDLLFEAADHSQEIETDPLAYLVDYDRKWSGCDEVHCCTAGLVVLVEHTALVVVYLERRDLCLGGGSLYGRLDPSFPRAVDERGTNQVVSDLV